MNPGFSCYWRSPLNYLCVQKTLIDVNTIKKIKKSCAQVLVVCVKLTFVCTSQKIF
jgi:hypothetical protein